MPIQWNAIDPNKGAKLTRPREIYASLEGREWPRLRPEQNEVLEAWFDRRNESDLVIKQNTGGGKTLTGLLIALSSLHEGVGPAVYLVPDTFLINQVIDEAKRAGIAATTDFNAESFQSSQAILVTTFHKLLNGRSVFGYRGSRQPLSIGIVIIDDAHAALSAAGGIFSVSIPSTHAAYDNIITLFESELQYQSPKSFEDIKSGDYGAPIRVPPKAVADKSASVMNIIRPLTTDQGKVDSAFFSWAYVADLLKYSNITITSKCVEVKTPCPDVTVIPSFRQAKRRVYLTATLEDEGILVTELNADPISVSAPITPKQASDLGDRIILAPLSINPGLTDQAIHMLAHDFATGNRPGSSISEPINVVVLVPSNIAAARWSRVADQTLNVTNMQPVIERMKNGEHVGLVVLVNKYDGVDLPAEACRLLVIDGVPTPLAPHEQRAAGALVGSMTYKMREVQRLEQGMGRGVRDVQDFCAVLLMSASAALTLRDSKLRAYYSPTTRAQIELSLQIADQITNEGIEAVAELLDLFLQRSTDWVGKSLAATADVTYSDHGHVTEISIGRRAAFNNMLAGDLEASVMAMRKVVDSTDDPLEQGWYLEELAGYQHHLDPSEAQQTLSAARRLNPAVTKPQIVSPRRRVTVSAAQSSAASNYLGQQYSDPRALELSVASLFDNVVWGVETAADVSEEQFRLIGLHLGFGSTRPEKEDRDGGPDNLWELGNHRYAVMELKTDVSRANPVIVKREASQLAHSLAWLEKTYTDAVSAVGIMIHPSARLDAQAVLPPGSRVMTRDDFERLRDNTVSFAKEIAHNNAWFDQLIVKEALVRHNLSSDRIINCHSRLADS